ncbi:MAG: sulfite exporter TauE/SafE family protein [Candidatus Pacebacteria bacterium]|nr:sulfite exporter TauE/SafE family protein [Candidatus Paceibacterota bacterium]
MNLLVIFLTGLTTGGLSCLAMQGGLLASMIANQKEQEHTDITSGKTLKKSKRKEQDFKSFQGQNFSLKSFDQLDWLPVMMFLLAKLVSHTILGFLLGLLGSAITLSLGMRLTFQVFTAIFMFATAMNLLDVHPIFRRLAFQPPKFLQRFIRGTSKSEALFAPAVLGLMTIFIPCGVTQAMEVLAINSGSPLTGAAIMFSFVLGTSPLFAILGVATAKLSEGWYQKFSKFAAAVLIGMAVYSINGVLLVADSPLTINKMVRPITYFFSAERFDNVNSVGVKDGIQQVKINVLSNGYQPRYIKVKSGVPVELTLESNQVYSCALAFVFREFGINTFLESTDSKSFTFTPTKKGKYTFSCSMGMYTGIMEVI